MIVQPNVVDASEQRLPIELVPTAHRSAAAETLFRTATAPPKAEVSESAMVRRTANIFFAGAKPSTTELERLIGNNDLVDEFYLQRALIAARPVMRIILRDAAARERGWATGFMVSPRLLLTNWHVFRTMDETQNAIAEANYVLDIAGNPAPSYRFLVRGDLYYLSDEHLDFALVAVDELAQDQNTPLSQFGYHRLIAEPNKILEGECMTLVQHPGGERRQFAIRENQLLKILDDFIWYASDTAPGSSGAPAFNDSFQVVGVHHSGAAKRDENGQYVLRDGTKVDSLDGIDDSQVDWIANEGLRISVLCNYLRTHLAPTNTFAQELTRAMQDGDIMSTSLHSGTTALPPTDRELVTVPTSAEGNTLTIPLTLQIVLSTGRGGNFPTSVVVTGAPGVQPAGGVGEEALRAPYIDNDYSSRTGYDENFLGIPAPVPLITDATLAACLPEGMPYIPYEHFTVVITKTRRLPLFTASNVDYSQGKRRPEPGDYSRKGLSGLGPRDTEKWITDPRLPEQDQLPNQFYDKDGQSFDKGHVVRREDVCWGDSLEQIRRANGDTFHVTNCTPQVAGFNRATLGIDNWGDLEDEVKKQAKTEQLSIFAGPILSDDDQIFDGRDDRGPVKIKIPRRFWKVILANNQGKLAAYAFVLQQDLSAVPTEFSVSTAWKPFLVSVAALEEQLSGVAFPPAIHDADQFREVGDELAAYRQAR